MASLSSGSADCGGDDDTLFPPPCCSEPTCWELSAASKTPNPRPTKTMRIESSNPPPLSEVVEDAKDKPTGEGRAEPETIEYDTDDILDDMEGWGFLPSGAEPDVKKKREEEKVSQTEEVKAFWASLLPVDNPPSPKQKRCDICFEDHYTSRCRYSSVIPYGEAIPNKEKYVILCYCGGISVDGGKCDNDDCLVRGHGLRSVIPRRSLYKERT